MGQPCNNFSDSACWDTFGEYRPLPKTGMFCRFTAILDGRLLADRHWWEIRVKAARFTR